MRRRRTMKRVWPYMKALKTIIINAIPVVFCSMFYCVFMYFQNAEEAVFFEVAKPLCLSLATGLGAYIFFAIFSRSWAKSVVGACVTVLTLTHYRYIENVLSSFLPALRYWQLVPVLAFVLFWLFFLYARKVSKEVVSTINTVIALVFGVLIAFNSVTALPTIIGKVKLRTTMKADNIEETDIADVGAYPNIYHFIMDEFSSAEVMQTYYGYDISWFTNDLESKHFVVGKDNRNETIDTDTILCNLINLDYIVNNGTSRAERVAKKKNSTLEHMLQEYSYDLIGLGYSSATFGIGEEVIVSQAQTVDGRNLEYVIMDNTVLYPFITRDSSEERNLVLNTFAWYDQAENLQGTNRYVLTYLLLPHEPFLFDENGDGIDETHYSDWQDKQYYCGQYIYTCKLLQKAVDSIICNDPGAIIVIQSDHSARAADDYELYLKWIGMHDARRSFNAVYYSGEEFESIDQRSGLNVLRAVLSKLFDTDALPQLEEPDYYNWQGGVFE